MPHKSFWACGSTAWWSCGPGGVTEGLLVDRQASPWDTPLRRPSHGDRRKALQRELMQEQFRRCGARGRGTQKLRSLFRALVRLVA